MSSHLRFAAKSGRRRHLSYHFRPDVAPLEERRMLSAGAMPGSPVVPLASVAAIVSPSVVTQSVPTDAASSAAAHSAPSMSPQNAAPQQAASPEPAAVDNVMANIGSSIGPQMALLSASGAGDPAPGDPPGVSSVTTGNPSSAGVSTLAAAASTSTGYSAAASAGAQSTLVSELQAVQSTFVVGAVPSPTGLSAPTPAVVAVFASQQAPMSNVGALPTGPWLSAPILNAPARHVRLTGGDVPPPAPAPIVPMTPSAPPTSSDLSNEARDQVLQEFARPQPPPPASEKAIDDLLQDMTDPSLPWLSPDVNDRGAAAPGDGTMLMPAVPGDAKTAAVDVSMAKWGLALETRPAQAAEPDSPRWVSLAAAAAATIGASDVEYKARRRRSDATRGAFGVERLLHV